MSGNDESSNGEERDLDAAVQQAAPSAENLLFAVVRNDADAVQQALRDGANVNAVRNDWTPLKHACYNGNAEIVGILLDAGADARRTNSHGWSAILVACEKGHLSTVQMLINHDRGLLEIVDNVGCTPLVFAIRQQSSDIIRFLLESGADAHHVDQGGVPALMHACQHDNGSLEIVRLLLDIGVDVEARDKGQRTALHWAAYFCRSELMCELIFQHNANIFAVNRHGRTPFDYACGSRRSNAAIDPLLGIYGNKLTHDHGRLALHELLKVAEYSFAEERRFHPPMNPLRMILPLGYLTLKLLRTLLHNLDSELIRNRDDTGKLPIHIACQTNAPVEVLTIILELDPSTLHIADSTGALPIHLLCGTTATTEYTSVLYLVVQGGVGTLAARDRLGLLPLHVLCRSTNPQLRAVRYLIQSFPGSVAVQTNAGQYPFMMAAAADSSSASLSVIYELVRAHPGLAVPR